MRRCVPCGERGSTGARTCRAGGLAAVGDTGDMTDDLVARHDLVVRMDYGQFTLHGGETALEDADNEAMLDQAQDGDGVAADDGSMLVLCPHQNNFAMPLTVEVWPAEPVDDLEQWDEGFEADLEVDENGELLYVSPTADVARCAVSPGRYRVRVVGRGIVARGWPGSTTPGDSWRVQMWPTGTGPTARRLRSWTAENATFAYIDGCAR